MIAIKGQNAQAMPSIFRSASKKLHKRMLGICSDGLKITTGVLRASSQLLEKSISLFPFSPAVQGAIRNVFTMTVEGGSKQRA